MSTRKQRWSNVPGGWRYVNDHRFENDRFVVVDMHLHGWRLIEKSNGELYTICDSARAAIAFAERMRP